MLTASRKEFLAFARADIDHEELEAIKETLESGWVTTGPRTKTFEAEFAAAVGVKHAVAVNSCTAALHLSLEAIGLSADDEVIVPAYTFAATAEVVRYFGARPVVVDVEPRFLNIDVGAVERAVTARTKAVIPVHLAGLPADMTSIAEISRRHGLRVIEDAAHSFPSAYQGATIGSCATSDAACFSFYATKTITTGEGGMVCTNDDAIAERCRLMALHGISKDAWKRYTAEGSWWYEVVAPGYKYNMTDIAASMGLAQLAKARRMWRRRREIAMRYQEAFARVPELEIPQDRDDSVHAWHLYMLRLRLERLHIDRARFIEELKLRNIGASVHFIPLHLHPYYRDTYGYASNAFPVAAREFEREVSLPIYSRMTDGDVADVVRAVTEIASNHATAGDGVDGPEVGAHRGSGYPERPEASPT